MRYDKKIKTKNVSERIFFDDFLGIFDFRERKKCLHKTAKIIQNGRAQALAAKAIGRKIIMIRVRIVRTENEKTGEKRKTLYFDLCLLKYDIATSYVYFPIHADFSIGWKKSEKIKQNQPRGLPVSQISNQRLFSDRIRLNDPLPIVTWGSEEVSLVPD